MKESKSQFYELLKSGLWHKDPAAELFDSDTDWKLLYKYSRQQGVVGLILDGINRLPEDLKPARPLYLKWCAEVLQIEDENHKLDKEVVNLFKFLRENGVNPVLMKGQGVGRNYPDPSHRISGDIDIYIGRKDYDKVNELLSREGERVDPIWSPIHTMFKWHDVEVENHRLMSHMDSPINNRNLHRLTDEWFGTGKVDEVEIDGYKVATPAADFDVMFLLVHTVVHLMGLGVGLRQICDWAELLHNKRTQINPEDVRSLLKKVGLLRGARVFGALCVNYLGLPHQDVVVSYSSNDEKMADILMEDIWWNGNFGFTGERIKTQSRNWVISRLNSLYNGSRRAFKFRKVSGSEAFWKPYKILSHFVRSRVED